MAKKKTFGFGDVTIIRHNLRVEIDLKRFERQFQEAQRWLDVQVMTDMKPFMPQNTGIFINLTSAQSVALAGSGQVVAAAPPTGRFLYYGKVMVDPETNSPWARPGAKKVVTQRPLTYSKPGARPEWFEAAKEKHGKAWVDGVKKRAGGG